MSPKPELELAKELTLHNHQHWHWMIHVKKFNRKNVLLVMDSDSRFCMAFWGLRKGGLKSFLEQFHERFTLHIITALKISGQEELMFETSMQAFAENHHKYALVQRGDRSIQAHINDAFMSLQYEQYSWEEDIPSEEDLFISDLKLNDTPRKRKQDKDYIFPIKVFLHTWLTCYANLNEEKIVDILSHYQQMNRQLWEFLYNPDINEINFEQFINEPT